MGFYSFYRIFKDIIKTFFGTKGFKLFLVFILIFIVIFAFTNTSKAADLRPWNVYTNTTEFNWSRLTNLNFVGGSANLPYKMYEIKPDEIYYLYNPNSNSGTIHYYCYTSNDVNRPMMLVEDTSFQAALHLDYNFEIPYGYIDIPYNLPFTPQMTFYVFITDTCELYLFDDKYSNIEAYNEIMETKELLKSLVGVEGDGIEMSSDTLPINAISNGSFVSASSYETKFFKVEPNVNYEISFTSSGTTNPDDIRYGYSNFIPSTSTRWSTYNLWGSSYPNPITFTSTRNSYYYVSYYKNRISNVSIKSNKNLISDINNQAQQTRDTLTDSNISPNSSDYTLPTDSTTDITQEGFNSIFERIRSTFTSGNSTPIVVTIPFTNKSFTISYNTVYGSANLGTVRSIIESFWWFVISLFICKDIFKKIEKLKTGNIEFTETTNIKEDIL